MTDLVADRAEFFHCLTGVDLDLVAIEQSPAAVDESGT